MSRSNELPFAPWQELQLNSLVQCQDGPAVMLSQLRLYPCCGALAQLAIRRSFWSRPRRGVVPALAVDHITSEQVTLGVPRAALDTFPADTSSWLRALGADWRATMPRPADARSDAEPNTAPCTPTGPHSAIGVLRHGMPVDCEDGRAGRLAMVLLDPVSVRVLQLVISRGSIVRRATTVPLGWVGAITPQRILLAAKRRRLEDLPPYHSDDEIVDDVRYGLRTSPMLRVRGEWTAIEVAAHNGAVLLYGNVRSRAQRCEAERIAQQIWSVRHVCNELIADDELQHRIQRALLSHTRLRVHHVEPAVDLGVVELAGEVQRPEHAAQAEQVVRQLLGVRHIRNVLRAQTPAERVSPADVRGRVVVQRRSQANERTTALPEQH